MLSAAYWAIAVAAAGCAGFGGAMPTAAVDTLFGIAGPAGLPKPVVAKLSQDIVTILRRAETRERFAIQGAEPAVDTTPESYAKMLRAEHERYRKLIGPKGMTAGQVAYWENVMRRMMEVEDWKKELEENFWFSNFRTGAESRKFLARDHEDARAFLTELGLAR